LLLQILLVVLKLSLLDSLNAVVAEVQHLSQTANLRGHVHNVQTLRTFHDLFQELIKSNSHYSLEIAQPNFNINTDLHR
jgi:hypothetical protein